MPTAAVGMLKRNPAGMDFMETADACTRNLPQHSHSHRGPIENASVREIFYRDGGLGPSHPETATMIEADRRATQQGVIFGISAYGLWGLIPLYFKAVGSVAPFEVLAHRAFWSFILLAVILRCCGRWGELWRQLHNVKIALMLVTTSALIATNWLVFIYAVKTQQVVQSSLGYFMNPLVNVFLGVVFLQERPRPCQMLSIALGILGVLVLTSLVGQFPWIAMVLALSMGFYGLLRKMMPVDSLMGVTVETLVMTPFALGYIGYLGSTHQNSAGSWGTLGLLTLSAPATTIPLLLFGGAARRLQLSTLGFLQYLTPTMHFLLAVVAFREPFTSAHVISFGCIWTAVLIYTIDSLRTVQKNRLAAVEID
jgi:chloramphenicol-sensitive protein RarD